MKLRFGDLLLESIRLYVKLLPLLTGIYLVFYLPVELVPELRMPWTLVMMGLGPLLHAFELMSCQQLHEGGALQPGLALKRAAQCFFPLLITTWLVGLPIGVGILLFVVPGLYLGVRLSMALPAVVFEGQYFDKAVKRSFELTQGRFWLIFWVSAVAFLPTTSIVGAMTFIRMQMPFEHGLHLMTQVGSFYFGQFGLATAYVLYRRLSDGAAPPPLEETGVGLNPAA